MILKKSPKIDKIYKKGSGFKPSDRATERDLKKTRSVIRTIKSQQLSRIPRRHYPRIIIVGIKYVFAKPERLIEVMKMRCEVDFLRERLAARLLFA